jgi:thiamine-binding periplasmic protein
VAGEIDPLLTSLPKIKVLDAQQPNADLVRQWLTDWQKAVSK